MKSHDSYKCYMFLPCCKQRQKTITEPALCLVSAIRRTHAPLYQACCPGPCRRHKKKASEQQESDAEIIMLQCVYNGSANGSLSTRIVTIRFTMLLIVWISLLGDIIHCGQPTPSPNHAPLPATKDTTRCGFLNVTHIVSCFTRICSRCTAFRVSLTDVCRHYYSRPTRDKHLR